MTRAAGDHYLAVKKSHSFYLLPQVLFNTPTCYVQAWWLSLWVGIYKPTTKR